MSRGASVRRRRSAESGVFPRLGLLVPPPPPPGAPAAAPPSRHRRPSRWWTPVTGGVALLGLAVGAGVAAAAARADDARVAHALDEALGATARGLEREATALGEVAHALRGLVDAADASTCPPLDGFARETGARHPAVRTVAWLPPVGVECRAASTARRGPRAVRDLRDDPAVRAAVAESRDAGGVAVLSPTAAVDGGGRLGAWVVLARPDEPGAGGGGAVALELGFDDLLHRLVGDAGGPDLTLALLEPGASPRVVAGQRLDDDGWLAAATRVGVLGRGFELRAAADPAGFAHHRGPSPWLLGAGAMLVWELVNAGLVGLARGWRREALDRQAARVHRVLESLGEAVVLTDSVGHVVLANDAARRMLGPDLTAPDGARRVLDPALRAEGPAPVDAPGPVRRALAGETVDADERRLALRSAPDGAWVEATARPLADADGAVEGALVVLRDVTARRQALEAARRLHERDVEMAMAQRIQRHLYPERFPAVPGLELAGAVVPAAATCGDYYDVLVRPDGAVLLAIGDVSGHGFGPALVMAEVRAVLRSLVDAGHGPLEVLRRLDAVLAREHDGELFVTLLLVEVTPWTRAVTYVNAGHVAGLVVNPRGEVAARFPATGPPLGLGEGRLYREAAGGTLGTGDLLVLVTDGATEAPGPDDEPFEETGVVETVRRRLDGAADEVVAAVRDAVHAYSGGRSRRDDVTVLVARATGR